MFSESIEQAGPLITVWLQVRVLPGPPVKTDTYKIADFSVHSFVHRLVCRLFAVCACSVHDITTPHSSEHHDNNALALRDCRAISDPLQHLSIVRSDGLKNVKVPIQLWASAQSGEDRTGGEGTPDYVSAIDRDLLIKPDYHLVQGAGHIPCALYAGFAEEAFQYMHRQTRVRPDRLSRGVQRRTDFLPKASGKN